jgi:hypothetical protein
MRYHQVRQQRLLRLAGIFAEARNGIAEVRAVEGGCFVDRTRKEVLAKRTERYEADAKLFQRGNDLLLGLAPS